MTSLIEKEYHYNNDNRFASRKEIEDILTEQVQLDDEFLDNSEMKEKCPISNDAKNIRGLKGAIETFKEIDKRKYDVTVNLSNVRDLLLTKIDNKLEIKFNIVSNEGRMLIPNAHSLYSARKKFLDHFFAMNKFTLRATDNEQLDIAQKTLAELQIKEQYFKNSGVFRFIDTTENNKDKTYLRAIIGNGYKTIYNNAAIFYMSIVAISRLEGNYVLDWMKVTDSTIAISYMQKDKVPVAPGLYLTTGIMVENSELGTDAGTFKVQFKISNKDGETTRFINYDEEIASINHGFTFAKIKANLNALLQFSSFQDDIIRAVKRIKWNDTVNSEQLNILTAEISHLRGNETADVRAKLLDEIDTYEQTKKAFSILELFSKFDKIVSNNSIKLVVEGKFYKWLKNL